MSSVKRFRPKGMKIGLSAPVLRTHHQQQQQHPELTATNDSTASWTTATQSTPSTQAPASGDINNTNTTATASVNDPSNDHVSFLRQFRLGEPVEPPPLQPIVAADGAALNSVSDVGCPSPPGNQTTEPPSASASPQFPAATVPFCSVPPRQSSTAQFATPSVSTPTSTGTSSLDVCAMGPTAKSTSEFSRGAGLSSPHETPPTGDGEETKAPTRHTDTFSPCSPLSPEGSPTDASPPSTEHNGSEMLKSASSLTLDSPTDPKRSSKRKRRRRRKPPAIADVLYIVAHADGTVSIEQQQQDVVPNFMRRVYDDDPYEYVAQECCYCFNTTKGPTMFKPTVYLPMASNRKKSLWFFEERVGISNTSMPGSSVVGSPAGGWPAMPRNGSFSSTAMATAGSPLLSERNQNSPMPSGAATPPTQWNNCLNTPCSNDNDAPCGSQQHVSGGFPPHTALQTANVACLKQSLHLLRKPSVDEHMSDVSECPSEAQTPRGGKFAVDHDRHPELREVPFEDLCASKDTPALGEGTSGALVREYFWNQPLEREPLPCEQNFVSIGGCGGGAAASASVQHVSIPPHQKRPPRLPKSLSENHFSKETTGHGHHHIGKKHHHHGHHGHGHHHGHRDPMNQLHSTGHAPRYHMHYFAMKRIFIPMGVRTTNHKALSIASEVLAVRGSYINTNKHLVNVYELYYDKEKPSDAHCNSTEEPCLFIRMEQLGMSLHRFSQRILKGRPMDEQFIAIIGMHVLKGLQVLHDQRRVIHCDVRPQNIMFCKEYRWVKVVDFGCSIPETIHESAEVAGSKAKRRENNMGNSKYSAPERSRAASGCFGVLGERVEITTAADIYSLGLVLLELAVGVFPRRFVDDEEQSRRSGAGGAATIAAQTCANYDPDMDTTPNNWNSSLFELGNMNFNGREISPAFREALSRMLDTNPTTRATACELLADTKFKFFSPEFTHPPSACATPTTAASPSSFSAALDSSGVFSGNNSLASPPSTLMNPNGTGGSASFPRTPLHVPHSGSASHQLQAYLRNLLDDNQPTLGSQLIGWSQAHNKKHHRHHHPYHHGPSSVLHRAESADSLPNSPTSNDQLIKNMCMVRSASFQTPAQTSGLLGSASHEHEQHHDPADVWDPKRIPNDLGGSTSLANSQFVSVDDVAALNDNDSQQTLTPELSGISSPNAMGANTSSSSNQAWGLIREEMERMKHKYSGKGSYFFARGSNTKRFAQQRNAGLRIPKNH